MFGWLYIIDAWICSMTAGSVVFLHEINDCRRISVYMEAGWNTLADTLLVFVFNDLLFEAGLVYWASLG
jgi:hypothetical protein